MSAKISERFVVLGNRILALDEQKQKKDDTGDNRYSKSGTGVSIGVTLEVLNTNSLPVWGRLQVFWLFAEDQITFCD